MKDNSGYVYILSNPDHDYLKIGYTSSSPEKRAEELNTTGVVNPFKVEWKIHVADPRRLEKRVHEALHKERISPNREFFHVPLNIATKVIKENLSNKDREHIRLAEMTAQERDREAKRKREAEQRAQAAEHAAWLEAESKKTPADRKAELKAKLGKVSPRGGGYWFALIYGLINLIVAIGYFENPLALFFCGGVAFFCLREAKRINQNWRQRKQKVIHEHEQKYG